MNFTHSINNLYLFSVDIVNTSETDTSVRPAFDTAYNDLIGIVEHTSVCNDQVLLKLVRNGTLLPVCT